MKKSPFGRLTLQRGWEFLTRQNFTGSSRKRFGGRHRRASFEFMAQSLTANYCLLRVNEIFCKYITLTEYTIQAGK